MMIRITAMLSLSGEIILQFSIILLMILFGLSSAYNFEYFSLMKSVTSAIFIDWKMPSVDSRMKSSFDGSISKDTTSGIQLRKDLGFPFI